MFRQLIQKYYAEIESWILKSLIFQLSVYTVAFLFIAASCIQFTKPVPQNTPTAAENKGFVVNIPQKAFFKNYVFVSVEASPGTSCELTYISPSGDLGHMDTTANTNGICSWRWKVDETKGKGDGRLIFTIEGISETHFIEIRSGF